MQSILLLVTFLPQQIEILTTFKQDPLETCSTNGFDSFGECEQKTLNHHIVPEKALNPRIKPAKKKRWILRLCLKKRCRFKSTFSFANVDNILNVNPNTLMSNSRITMLLIYMPNS